MQLLDKALHFRGGTVKDLGFHHSLWGFHWLLSSHQSPFTFRLYGTHPHTCWNFSLLVLMLISIVFCKCKLVTLIWGNRASALLCPVRVWPYPMSWKVWISLRFKCFFTSIHVNVWTLKSIEICFAMSFHNNLGFLFIFTLKYKKQFGFHFKILFSMFLSNLT